MPIPQLTANDLFNSQKDALKLDWIAGRKGKDKLLETTDASYPGIALVGYLNSIHPNPVQIIGKHEMNYLINLDVDQQNNIIEYILSRPATSVLLVSDGLKVPQLITTAAEKYQIPVFTSEMASPVVVDYLHYYLTQSLAPRTTLHGVYLEVFGIGVFVTGKSGIGKSEIALELLSRNHRLIADDAVEFVRASPDALIGRCPDVISNYLEIRGLGVLDIRTMFGGTAIRNRKKLNLVVHLKDSVDGIEKEIDRLQANLATLKILEVNIPEVVLFVAPGRNLAVLVEAATRSYILRMTGNNPADDFIKLQQEAILKKDK